ncbi:hypothetical protein CJ030_MR5G010372 [Morella rubra]|uniref:Uncharacterized protein n=1 Tax=Morella rubra TaxID=262757 RepID=A0A6A1VNL1_9ROSI|nr:hypothetical protein CJ030_MR5G010372 [Morella rubra]
MAQETASVPMYVDDFYFSVLADDESKNQAFLVSDAKYAEELQFQEVMMGSLITSQMANNGASSSSSPMVQLSLPPAMLLVIPPIPIPNPEPVEGTEEAGAPSSFAIDVEENGLNIVVVAREIRYGAEKLH